jgi:hypothetical protein
MAGQITVVTIASERNSIRDDTVDLPASRAVVVTYTSPA